MMENKLDHTSPLYCIAYYYPTIGRQYLAGIETHHYGTTVQGWFSQTPSCAIPLSLHQAEQLKEMLERDVPKNVLRIMPVPWDEVARK